MKKRFVPISWSEVKEGQLVYLVGKRDGKVWHYGPHTVSDPERRELSNPMGRRFLHYPEELAVEVTP